MNPFTIGSAFLMGLFGGVHCVLMCGGLVGLFCAGLPTEQQRTLRGKLGYLLAYNAGRIGAYTSAGLLAGGFGALALASAPFHGAQIALRLVAALVMLGAGLHLAGFFRAFARIEAIGRPLARLVEPFVRQKLRVRSYLSAALLGLCWGFLPCGMVYAALALALVSGSWAGGGATMLAFGLGTLPALLVAGTLAEGLRGLSRIPRVRQSAGLFIALSGSVHLMLTGLQAGWIPASLLGDETPTCCAHAHGAASQPAPGAMVAQ